MIEVIFLILIIAILSGILFLALKKIITGIASDSKNYYFKKMQEYDADIAKKEEKLSDIEAKEDEKDKKEIVEKNDNVVVHNALDRDFLDNLNQTEYEGTNPLITANRVDEIFKVDEERVLRRFLSRVKINPDYVIYQAMEDRFSPNLIYKLKMLDTESQIKEITKLLSDKEFELFNSYVTSRPFRLNKFLIDLDLLIENNIPIIEVYTGSKVKDFNYLSPYVRTIYSDDIYKGIIIKYQDRIYDYSINERSI